MPNTKSMISNHNLFLFSKEKIPGILNHKMVQARGPRRGLDFIALVISSKCSVLTVLGTYNFGEGITSHLITEQRILRGFGRDL